MLGKLKKGFRNPRRAKSSVKQSASNQQQEEKGRKSVPSPMHKQETSQRNKDRLNDRTVTEDSVYDYYNNELWPALVASLPLLMHRLSDDLKANVSIWGHRIWDFMLPAWIKEDAHGPEHISNQLSKSLGELWERAQQQSASQSASFAEFLRHLDKDGDGHLHMNELIARLQAAGTNVSITPLTFWSWSSREWPLMDWKIGVFLWRTFGGILVVLLLLSIIPGRLHSLSGKVLRWPILLLTYFLISVELMAYIVIRLFIRIAEFIIATPRHRALRRKLAQSTSYEEWFQYAAALDISQKRDRWQKTVRDNHSSSYRYNWALIRQLIEDMRLARSKHDILLAEAVLQQATRKNVGGIMSEDLFCYTNTGEPKYIVKEFIREVTKTLLWITEETLHLAEQDSTVEDASAKNNYQRRFRSKMENEEAKLWKSVVKWATLTFGDGGEADFVDGNINSQRPRMPSDLTMGSESQHSDSLPKQIPRYHKEQLIAFLHRARAAYGRTALCLSGGAMMGMYHFGHLQGLMETDALPHIVSGTSAGSAVAAILCTRTKEELKRDLKPEIIAPKMKCFDRSWPDRLRSVWKNGHMFGGEEWLQMIQWFTNGQLTFEEAYRKTGRIFCITLASTTKKAPPVLLNYITAANVTIASAVIASAAVPGFIAPVRLQVKDPDGTVRSAGEETYFDGSIEHDIPINGLAEQLNCQFFVAAQCNPHVVPFFFNPKGGVGSPSRWSSGEHEASWRGGFLLAALEMYLKNDMKAKFRFLHDMEAAVGFTSAMMAQEFVGSITIVPRVAFWDFFTLFSDPTPASLERCFQVGAIAAYQHAAMIRLHYKIADTLDLCLERLGAVVEGRRKSLIKASRRVSFENNKLISAAIAHMHDRDPPNTRPLTMPEVISAALNERLDDSETASISDGSYPHQAADPKLSFDS